ncbi:pantetheine-phosphate adenylyltransferase [marine gamma proteobacterium HTCC2143]|jgi:pantetheine-phosphate adenylyltransferase|uniref:Phosphopantetheine adenylyltransferase n=1 Tax=marine gamma proteobacterium HTCC2143 TaxID=247633 RepID=A0Y9M8_9GAMM|nr:pantetheine-phosphate adenylyltransferase [marine gamma proteobacterium HTCC2143]|tara:strand:- start:174 stop:653 length:480 start_codon:yes stop_codon:yes gene_type:complete
MNTVIYPGTFNPITNGHIDLVERASKLFGKVVLAIAYSERKQPMFSLDERIDLCQQALSHLDNIEVCGFNNLLVEFAQSKNSNTVLRGVRSMKDFEYEIQMADMNRAMTPGFETVFLTPSDGLSYISSTLVREISTMGGDVSSFVPAIVLDALNERIKS